MKNLEEQIKKIIENLGVGKAATLYEKASILRDYLCSKYGAEHIGKIKVKGDNLVVEIKSATLRNELFIKKVELLEILTKDGVVDLPKDLEFVGRL